ncbi:hypothetical protein [Actinocorallia aurea]
MADAEVERSRAAGDPVGEVEGLYGLARVALREGDLEQATGLAQRAIGVARRAGERRLEERHDVFGSEYAAGADRTPGRAFGLTWSGSEGSHQKEE